MLRSTYGLTYKVDTNITLTSSKIIQVLKQHGDCKYIVGKEIALTDEGQTSKWYVFASYSESIEVEPDSEMFDCNGIHPHINKTTPGYSWKQRCMNTHEMWTNLSEKESPVSFFESPEATAPAPAPAPAPAAPAPAPAAPAPAPAASTTSTAADLDLYPWQKQCIDLLLTEAHPIHHIFDRAGNTGMSFLAKHAAQMYESISVLPVAKLHFIEDQPHGTAYLIDATRGPTRFHFFKIIESMKNRVPSPQIVVLNNKLPEYNLLSKDRWRLYTIEDMALVEKATAHA